MIPTVILLLFFLSDPAAKVSEDDLPDLDSFLENIQKNLRSDRLLQSQYTFNMKQSNFERDKEGDLRVAEVKEYEVYPFLDEELTYRRLVSENNQPLAAKEIEKQDREHDKKLKKLEEKLEKEGIDFQTYQIRTVQEEKRKEEEIISELPRIYDISIAGRTAIDGRNALILEFRPRPNYKPHSRETDILAKLAGRAWFCEQDYQLMRSEVEFVDDLSMGWGLLARLHKGTKATLRRQYVNNEVWMPTEVRFTGTARVLLLKKIRINTVNEFSNYRKFTVKTSLRYGGAQ